MRHQNLRPAPLALAIALALGAAAVQAQGAAAPVTPIPFAIQAQPLEDALNAWARQTRIQFIVQQGLVAGKTAPAVAGTLTPRQALDRLLAGSGLVAIERGRAIVIQVAPPAGEATLAPVTVTAIAERDGTTEGAPSFTTRTMSSATHLPLTMRETPQSVTVLSSARIAADNLVDLVDIAKATPGLRRVSNDARPNFESRGFVIDSMTQDGIASEYIGDEDTLGNLAMQDRVEVVRGATGLMQGAGNPAAAINMVRKRPTSTWQFNASASAGSWDDHRLMADVSGPLTADGRVRARVVGYVQDAGDFYDLAFNDKRLGYATVDVDLTERTTLNIGYSHVYSNRNLSWGGMPTSDGFEHLGLPRSTFVGADWEYDKNQADTLYASLNHDFGEGWKLDFNGAYVERSYDMQATWLVPTPEAGGYGHVWYAAQTARRQKAANLKVSGPVSWFGRQHDVVLGATVNHQSRRTDEWMEGWDNPLTSGVDLAHWNHVAPRPDTSTLSPWLTLYPTTLYKQHGLYTAGKFNVADTLDLLLGGRLDWFNREDPATGAPYTVNAHLTKYAGLTWKFSPQHSAYASYTDVFQPQNARDLSGKLLPPKSGENHEVGVKGEYLDGALNGSVALFRIDENNRAAYLSDQSACSIAPQPCYAASGLVRTEGVDIELQGALTPDWQIGAGLTWSETRYRKDIDAANVGRRFDTTAPTTQFKLSTRYTLPGALNRWTLGGRINWQSKMHADDANARGETVRNQQAAYAVLDLSAAYRLTKNVSIKFDVNNVFDKVYYASISSNTAWSAVEAYGRPRSALLTLNASY